MRDIALQEKSGAGLEEHRLAEAIRLSLEDGCDHLEKILLIVPDFTRFHSNAGLIANQYYQLLKDRCRVDLLVALGTHAPMTEEECTRMYGIIPYERFLMHNWRSGIKRLGQVPGAFVAEVSQGLVKDPIDVEVNQRLWAGYDLIVSIGQVVPHEVVGMANYSKNIFVGCGGAAMINASHMLGAFCGMERIMGKDHTPVRDVFDYAQRTFLSDLPLRYALTVTTAPGGNIRTHGLFIGRSRDCFERAVALSQAMNLTFVQRPLRKVIVYLDPQEFRSTWLGNKGIYRTRMAIADQGNLLVLAPGVEKFGEDDAIDKLIRKYGYTGRENIIRLCRRKDDLQANLSAAAHLIHGSSDGRFTITYCTRQLTKAQVEGVGFSYMPYEEAARRYDPAKMSDGWNTMEDGEQVYYISNPALGLWADHRKYETN